MPTDTPHLTAEQVDLTVAGGLTDPERAAVAVHVSDCPACAAAVEAATAADADLRRTLAAVPEAGLEDRIVANLRVARGARFSPAARRSAAVAAAVAVVVGTGWAGSALLTSAGRSGRARVASNLHQIGAAILRYNPGGSNGPSGDAERDPFADGQLYPRPQAAAPVPPSPNDAVDSLLIPTLDGTAAKSVSGRTGGYRFGVDGRPNGVNDRPGSGGYHTSPGGTYRSTQNAQIVTGNVSGLNYFHGSAAGPGPRAAANAPAPLKPGSVGQGEREQRADAVPVEQEAERPVEAAGEGVGRPGGGGASAAAAGGPTGVAVAAPAATRPVADGRRVIRTGTMAFEVDRFDTAADTIAKVAAEAGGFVATTESAKGANGKTAGTITVRCPPERLDLLVLGLRALGDLKSQQIVAQDVTKEYTDDEAELVADRAMQDRLLELIRTGHGSIKDLLAAENELGTWRTKIERLQGQLRYLDAQVGLSTLAVSLSERDLRRAAATVETETADVGVETDDVERARDAAVKAVDDAGGRVVEAELKHLDAGQLAARVVADVPAERAGATLDRLRQLGRVARLEVHRQQTAGGPSEGAPVRTERRPTRVTLSIYNLANVAPRRAVAVTLAAEDPEAAYAAVLALAGPGGRVVTSNLDRSANATGTVALEIPPQRLEAALATVRSLGAVLKRTATVAADTQDATDAKVGLTVTLVSLADVPPRETTQQAVAAADVPAAYRAVLATVGAAGGRVRTASLNEQDRQNVTADVQLDVPRAGLADFDRAVTAAGETVSRQSARSDDAEHTADVAVRVQLSLVPAERLPPRESTTLTVEVTDVDRAAADAEAVAAATGGRVASATVNRSPTGPATARVVLDVPLARAAEAVRDLRQLGTVRGVDSGRDATALAGPLAHAHVEVDLATADTLVAETAGPGASIRHGLSVGLAGLLWSLQVIVVGLCLLVPWAAVAYVARRAWRRVRGNRVSA